MYYDYDKSIGDVYISCVPQFNTHYFNFTFIAITKICSRTHTRGHNLPVDPETMAEREKKRQANQEHLEALKQQVLRFMH